MVFQGEVLPIGALLERAQTAPAYESGAGVGVRHTAVNNAARCAVLLAAGDTPEACWRFGILQTLDDCASTLRRGGMMLAAQVFAAEPQPTGSASLDAAFAALADHLADRDGWPAPAWVMNPAPGRWLVSGGASDLPSRGRPGQPEGVPPARHSRHRTVAGPRMKRVRRWPMPRPTIDS